MSYGQMHELYKRTSKGLLVTVDDAVVERSGDEDNYVVEVTPTAFNNGYTVIMAPGEGTE